MMEIVKEQRTVIKGLSAMAEKLGVSKGHLSLVLHGGRAPSPRLAKKLAKQGLSLPIK